MTLHRSLGTLPTVNFHSEPLLPGLGLLIFSLSLSRWPGRIVDLPLSVQGPSPVQPQKRPGLLTGAPPGLRARAALRAEQSPPPQSMGCIKPSWGLVSIHRWPPLRHLPGISSLRLFCPWPFQLSGPRFRTYIVNRGWVFFGSQLPGLEKGWNGSLPMRWAKHKVIAVRSTYILSRGQYSGKSEL